MKTIYTSLFCILLLISCNQEVPLYSCDPVINEYVTNNKEELTTLTVKDLSSADLQFQQAVFRSYSPEKKREIWIQKINSLLENEEYCEDEYAHIKKILNHLSSDYFTPERLNSNADQRSQFASEWINYAKKNLGWTDKQVAFVVYRIYTSQTQFELELKALAAIQQQSTSNSEGSCDCNISENYCPSNCRSGKCNITSGCGWLWSGSCNGTCN